ncbi:HdrD3 [Desulforapulum autotrophicum HRM2]|uniref:HdrD3 n=1 Tax=Desulforapulum autotrophicum (strain ATCC 43914 / DSM 3382 / VKM B-1955 / HRM2) TaxID=177437 RepID=C0QJA8_DESAH|nr:LUD domain-containing protein [Desulforapulum autotrophicum]ACN15921.1 HdrD3 [Desulforapulum autotrophicum HRM2]
MQKAENIKKYKREVDGALANDFLRLAMDKFAVAYRGSRENVFSGMDVNGIIAEVAGAKDAAIARMDELYELFKQNAEKAGITVHLAETALEANEIICKIAKDNDVSKIIKSKSMTAEETLLNHHLEANDLEVTETDLGEWIIQLRHEGPSHMVMPAIHLSRNQVGELFTDVTGKQQPSEDIDHLVKVARQQLRQKFIEADMGISGANFALADTGTLGIITNEGNARLVTTLPRVHVALVGLEKLMPTLHDALTVNRVLPRNATGQAITSYVTWISGPNECKADATGRKQMHIVFLDNGRRKLAKDPVFSQVLRCVRCGACANVCPVYRMVGGHQMGHIYIGAIGLIMTYFFHGRDKAKNLVQNCINCGACKSVCAAGIDLPGLIKEVHARILDETGHPLTSVMLSKVMQSRELFHRFLRYASFAQKPVVGKTGYIRHLPMIFAREHDFKAIPAIAERPFREIWESVRPSVENPRYRVALFSGCVQDFVYPEQLVAGLQAMAGHGVAVDFPMDQNCCGLPLQMMGEKSAAREVAAQNVAAIDPDQYDYIVTLCASCASHLKNAYPKILDPDSIAGTKAKQFSDKIISFSSFMNDVIQVRQDEFTRSDETVTYHAPCHLCRGLGVKDAPHELIQKAGVFAPAQEEETCCGFGGTYSGKFPQISKEILNRKLDDVKQTGADILVTECPGCVMQLRGGAEKRCDSFRVLHMAEFLAKQRK